MCLAENNHWPPTFNHSIQKDHEASSMDINDRLSELPNDVLLLILSFLTTEEVKRTSVISKKWRRWLLGYYPKLCFDGSSGMLDFWHGIRHNVEELAKQRSSFIRRVDHVMKQHLYSSIDEFKVVFDLDRSCQSHVDKWVAFALTKRAKKIELNFGPVFYTDSVLDRCGLSINYCKSVNHSLASLCLKCVNITSEDIESILLSCTFLENLCINDSEFLTSIKSSSSSLKHLDVSYCDRLQKIDISAPKMAFFRYLGQPTELNIRNASSLSSVFIGVGGDPSQEIAYAFDQPLSKYFPQLEVLNLQIPLSGLLTQYNIGVEHLRLPLLTKLKVLELHIIGDHLSSLLGWTPLIEACVVLEKLIVKFDCYDIGLNYNITKSGGSPLKSLKTLEIFGYCGRRIDIEFAAYVFENAVNLQHVFVEVELMSYNVSPDAPIRISKLKEIIPEGVSFVLKES